MKLYSLPTSDNAEDSELILVDRDVLSGPQKVEESSKREQSGLLCLPPEIRELIWAFSSTFEGRLKRHAGGIVGKRSVFGLPATCRQIENECTKFFYESNNFMLYPPDADSRPLANDSEKSTALGFPLRYLPHVKSLYLEIDSECWFSQGEGRMISWLRRRAISVEKIQISINADCMSNDLVEMSYIPDIPSECFAIIFSMIRVKPRFFKILRSFPGLCLLDIVFLSESQYEEHALMSEDCRQHG